MPISPQTMRAIEERIARLEWRARRKLDQPAAPAIFACDGDGLLSAGPLPPGISIVSIPAGRFVSDLHPQLSVSAPDHAAAWDAYLDAAAQAAADDCEIPPFSPPTLVCRVALKAAPPAPPPVARLEVKNVVKFAPKKTRAHRDEDEFERRFSR